jgi:hypothetical protein
MDLQLTDAQRQQLQERNAAHGTDVYLLIGEKEAYALAAGFLPTTVQAQARTALAWNFKRARRRPRRARA